MCLFPSHDRGGEKNYENLFIQSIEATEGGTEEEKNESSKINKHTLTIITHHCYLLRKGEFSDLYYSVLKWVSQNDDVTVIIDEVDTFIEKSTYSIQLGNRFLKRGRKGFEEPVYIRQKNCPASKKSGKCEDCLFSMKNQFMDVSSYNLPVISSRGRVAKSELEEGSSIEFPEFTFTDEIEVDSRNADGNYRTQYKNIETHKNYRDNKTYKFKLEDVRS